MSRLRFTGTQPVQLPTPFGYLVQPGDVVEIPDHLVHLLRQRNIGNAFAMTPGNAVRLPDAELWVDADAAAAADAEGLPIAPDSVDAQPKLGAEKTAPARAQRARAQAVAEGDADPVGTEEGAESEGAPS